MNWPQKKDYHMALKIGGKAKKAKNKSSRHKAKRITKKKRMIKANKK
jgi:hypothetical protein